MLQGVDFIIHKTSCFKMMKYAKYATFALTSICFGDKIIFGANSSVFMAQNLVRSAQLSKGGKEQYEEKSTSYSAGYGYGSDHARGLRRFWQHDYDWR
jgi:hypothetical protein